MPGTGRFSHDAHEVFLWFHNLRTIFLIRYIENVDIYLRYAQLFAHYKLYNPTVE